MDTLFKTSVLPSVKTAVIGLLIFAFSQQASAKFRVVSTPPMNVARRGHVAAKLLDGRVLIVGGTDPVGGTILPAEIYDPATNTFSLTGPTVVERYGGHAAVTLPDGRILVIGGSSSRPNSTEVYDPETGRFAFLLELLNWQSFATATLLHDDRVLVFSGHPDGVSEVIDPMNKTTVLVFSLNTSDWGHTATLLEDGTVLITGGEELTGFFRSRTLALADVFDPSSNTFFPVGNMTVARQGHTATRLPDGRVLIAGGQGGTGSLSSVEIFDPKTRSFSDLKVTTFPRSSATAALFPGGKVVVTGGAGPEAVRFSEVLVVAHPNVAVEQAPPLSFLRYGHSVVKISDHVAFITGGDVFQSEGTAELLVFETRRRAVRR